MFQRRSCLVSAQQKIASWLVYLQSKRLSKTRALILLLPRAERMEGGRLRVGWLTGRGAARAEDAQGTPTQSHLSSSILVYEEHFFPEVDSVDAAAE